MYTFIVRASWCWKGHAWHCTICMLKLSLPPKKIKINKNTTFLYLHCNFNIDNIWQLIINDYISLFVMPSEFIKWHLIIYKCLLIAQLSCVTEFLGKTLNVATGFFLYSGIQNVLSEFDFTMLNTDTPQPFTNKFLHSNYPWHMK
jgi:hypothetical protein